MLHRINIAKPEKKLCQMTEKVARNKKQKCLKSSNDYFGHKQHTVESCNLKCFINGYKS